MNKMDAFGGQNAGDLDEEVTRGTSSYSQGTTQNTAYTQSTVNQTQYKPKKKVNKKVLLLLFWITLTIVDLLVPDPIPFVDEILLVIADSKMLHDVFRDANNAIANKTGLYVDTERMAKGFAGDLKQNGVSRASVQSAAQRTAQAETVNITKQVINNQINK